MKNRILWVDWAKFLAIFAIILIHSSSSFLTSLPLFKGSWFISLFFEAIARWGVPVFIMVSGYLLLRKEYELGTFLKKRLTRVLVPFIFWNFAYIIIKLIMKNPISGKLTIFNVLSFIVHGFLDPTIVTVQFWFVYMIIGLYLMTPILSRWIKNATEGEINYFLIIWLIVMVINLFNIDFLLLKYITLFGGVVGYFILGYYIAMKIESREKTLLVNDPRKGLLLFIIGFVCIMAGTIFASSFSNGLNLMMITQGDVTPFALLESLGIFIIIINLTPYIKNEFVNKIATEISKASYGIYLVNILVIDLLIKVGVFTSAYLIILYAAVSLIVSYIIIRIMKKLPVLTIFSGA